MHRQPNRSEGGFDSSTAVLDTQAALDALIAAAPSGEGSIRGARTAITNVIFTPADHSIFIDNAASAQGSVADAANNIFPFGFQGGN
jgi:hypothetical protein